MTFADAVTIVIYHMMEAFMFTPEINHIQVFIEFLI